MDLFAERLAGLETENAFTLGPMIDEIEAKGQKVIKLNLGEPDFTTPKIIKEEIKRQLDLNNTHYVDPKGLLILREAISQHIHETRGITVSPDQVVVFPGAKPAIGFAQQVYCNPGDEIIYPSPGFPIYESFIRYFGAVPKPVYLKEQERFVLTPANLSEVMSPKTKLLFLNFPSNPTGSVANKKQLEDISVAILQCCDSKIRVYSDEIYESIIFDGEKHHSIASIPGMERYTIISSGFSKTYAWTGGRIGYAVFPTVQEADVFKNLNINYFSCVPPYNQMAACLALQDKGLKPELDARVAILEKRRDFLVKGLNEIPGVHCQTPGGAFYVFPNIHMALANLGLLKAYQELPLELQTKTSPSTLFQRFALHHHYVAVLDRRSFGIMGSENQHYIRLSLGQDISILEEGLKRLSDAFKDHSGVQDFLKNSSLFI